MDEALATEDFTLSDIGDGEQLIKELGEGLPQRIAYIGAEHRCRFVNQAFIRWCGRPREEVVGHLMSAVLGADAYQTLRPLVDQALAGVTIKHQVDVLKADGRHELREIVLVPHHGGGGAGLATRGCFWIASDTTPQLGEQQRQQQFERDRGAALELLASGADTDRVLDLLARAIESRFPGALVKVSMDGSSCPPTASAPPAGAGHLLSVPIVLGAERAVGTVWCRLPALPGDAPTDQHLAGVMTALQSCAQIAALAAARRELDRRLAYQAQHDDLTGLPNRLLFEEHVHLLLAAARRRPSRMALVVIDLDDFKRINDALGHAAGDQLLRMFSDRLARCTRGGDLLGRIAGDEFVILLRDLPPGANAHTIAARLCDRLHAPLTLGEHEVHLFASFGVSNFPEDGSDASTLLRKADIAMSRAKADGKKRVATFTPDLLIEASDRLTLEGALRRALDRHELSLHLQPQVDLRSRRVVSFEALCRWNHPRLGVVAPSKFIACAEETGLIIPLGTWVIGEACRQARALSQQGHPGVRMAVNVSAAQFLQGDLVDIVQRAVRECQL
ncbi:MAG TPA: diguanylate cyclase, partial [Polyangia bacterium]|nr:diguanylate cyclase [Polyangia bacterium]